MTSRSRSLVKGSVVGFEHRSDSDQRGDHPRGSARPSVFNPRKQGTSPARGPREENRALSVLEEREQRQSRIDGFLLGGNVEEGGWERWGMSRKAFVRSVYSNVRPQYSQAKREGAERTLKNVASLVLGSTRALLICQRVLSHWLDELHKEDSEEVSEEEEEEEEAIEEEEDVDEQGDPEEDGGDSSAISDYGEAFGSDLAHLAGPSKSSLQVELDEIEQMRSKISTLAQMAGASLELLKEAFKGHLSESLAMSKNVAAQLAATDESIQAVEREVLQARMRLQETFQAKADEILSDFGEDDEDTAQEWQVFDQHRKVHRRRSWALVRTESKSGHQVDAQTGVAKKSSHFGRPGSIELGDLSGWRQTSEFQAPRGTKTSAPPSAPVPTRAHAKKEKLERLQAVFQKADEELCQNSLARLLAKTEEVANDTPPGTQIGWMSRLQQATEGMRQVTGDLYVAKEPSIAKAEEEEKEEPFEQAPSPEASCEVEEAAPVELPRLDSQAGMVPQEEASTTEALSPTRVRQRSVQLSMPPVWKAGRRPTDSHEHEHLHIVDSPRQRSERLSVLATTSPVLNFHPTLPVQPAGGKERQNKQRATIVGTGSPLAERSPRLQRGRWSISEPQDLLHAALRESTESAPAKAVHSELSSPQPEAVSEERQSSAPSRGSSVRQRQLIIEEENSSGEDTQLADELEECEESERAEDVETEDVLWREPWQEVSPRNNAVGLPRGRHHPPRRKEARNRTRLSFPSDALMVQQLSCPRRTAPTPVERDRDSSVDAAASASADGEELDDDAANGQQVEEDKPELALEPQDEMWDFPGKGVEIPDYSFSLQGEQDAADHLLQYKADHRKLIVKLGADWKISERLRISLQKPGTPGGWPELEAYRSEPKRLVCQSGAEVPLPFRAPALDWTTRVPPAAPAGTTPPCVETVCSERHHLARIMLDMDEAHSAPPRPANLPPLLLRPPPPLLAEGGKVKPHRPFGTLMAPETRRAEPPPSVSHEASVCSRRSAPRAPATSSSPRHSKPESIVAPKIKSARGIRTTTWRGGMATVDEIPKELLRPAKRPLHQRLLDAQQEEFLNSEMLSMQE